MARDTFSPKVHRLFLVPVDRNWLRGVRILMGGGGGGGGGLRCFCLTIMTSEFHEFSFFYF